MVIRLALHRLRALGKASAAVEHILSASGCEYLHQYSWPDGSLYKFVRTDLNDAAFRALFDSSLIVHVSMSSGIHEKKATDKQNEFNGRLTTLEEAFNAKAK